MTGFHGEYRVAALSFRAAATAEIHVGQLRPSPRQPRRNQSSSDIAVLAESIRQVGLLEPLCVRPLREGCYEIIAGERRWRAAQLAGVMVLPCRLYDDLTEDGAFVLGLVENLQRRDLSSLEEARAYQEMLDRGIAENRAAIARLVGVSRQRITQRMKLLELDEATQTRLQDHQEVLTEYHARLLWEVKDLAARHRLADAAVEDGWSGSRLRREVRRYLLENDVARWQSGARSLPRAWTVRRPGFSVTIDFLRADLRETLKTVVALAKRLESLLGPGVGGATESAGRRSNVLTQATSRSGAGNP